MADSNGKDEPPDGTPDPLEQLRNIIGVPIDDDFADIPTPTRWPDIASTDAAVEWEQLRAWVEDLSRRFPHLDHHVTPAAGGGTTATSKRSPPCAPMSAPATQTPLLPAHRWTGSGRFAISPRFSKPGRRTSGAAKRTKPRPPPHIDRQPRLAGLRPADITARQEHEIRKSVQ
ncbi:MAG: hypothetical protein ACYCO3_04995 [Mycobacteriales bacterium]